MIIFDFMNFLSNQGYLCIIHDHRGHGKSIKDKYFDMIKN